jgi:hypothetical protein
MWEGFSSFASFPKGVQLLFVNLPTNKNARLANVLNEAEAKTVTKNCGLAYSFLFKVRWAKN